MNLVDMTPTKLSSLSTATFFIGSIFSFYLIPLPLGFGADPESMPAPSVFQPNETQHGFSEFESLPEIPPEDRFPSAPEQPSADQHGNPPDLDNKPGGLFFKIQFAEGFEEEQGLRRGHLIVPVNPRTAFPPNTRAVFLVFSVFKHYAPYQVFGRLYREEADLQSPSNLLDEDTMYLAAEDESGYLQFFPQSGHWDPGIYKVKIYIGYQASDFNHMGTMRFSIISESSLSPTSQTAPP